MAESIEYVELDKNSEYIQIHGLQRSGTNYVTHLINENFPAKVLVNCAGWKHGHYQAPWIVGKEIHVMTVIKNPYAWLTSVYNYWGPDRELNIGPDLTGVSFEEFVTSKVYLEKQRDVPYLLRASNPVQHWNNMNFHWSSIRLNNKCLFLLTYEMTLSQPAEVIKQIGLRFGLEPNSTLINSDKKFLPSGESSTDAFDKNFYMRNEFLKMYTPDLIEFVNNQLDLDLLVRFGYPIIKPEDLK